MPPSLPPGTPPMSAGHLVFELLSHVRACRQCQNKQCQCLLRERIQSRATSSSHGTGPRETKSWCSRWLPTLPLSSEVGGRQRFPESAGVEHNVEDSAVALTAPVPSAATVLSEAPTSSAAPTSDGVPSSPRPTESPAPAPLLSTLPVPPPKQQALPPPAPVPPAPAPLAKKGRLKGSAALRNAEMERALRLQWSALSESERAMLIAGAHSPAHVSQQ